MFSADAFVRDVDANFIALLQPHGYARAGQHVDSTYASVTYESQEMYVRVVADRRDQRVYAVFGRLIGGRNPGPVWLAPKSAEEVVEFELGMVIWRATGQRPSLPELGEYESEDDASVSAAIEEIAAASEAYAKPVLAGDRVAWGEIADLMMSRT